MADTDPTLVPLPALLPLDAWHRARGGRMVAFAGYAMPVQYDGIIAEHRWVRESAGLFDVSHMGQLLVHGNDADAALAAGKSAKARRILVSALSHHRPDQPPPPVTLSVEQARALIDILPEPLPTGDPWNEYILANQLMRLGRFEDAAHYAADAYGRHPHTLAAATVARAAGALGDQATAIGWLRTAAEAGTSPSGLATIIDSSPELIGIRQHPDVVSIRRDIAAAHAL